MDYPIHLNLDKFKNRKSARTRFTFAHELDHYFIDSHRKQLSKGRGPVLQKGAMENSEKKIEKKADHFAANLLMPRKNFIRAAKKYDPGFEAILGLKSKYDTSIECTCHHYMKHDLSNCIMIK